MRCTHTSTERESRDGHHMILVPLDEVKNDHLVQWTNVTFGCLSTCESIKKRKMLNLFFDVEFQAGDVGVSVCSLISIFELLYLICLCFCSGEMVDERAVHLKLCRCPERDIDREEKKLDSPQSKHPIK
jgi:P53 DNA-binding domain